MSFESLDEQVDPVSIGGQIASVLTTMLRTAYGYASDFPDVVHVYIQPKSSSFANTAEFGVLFEIGEKVFDKDTLAQARVKDRRFDVSQSRQSELQKYLLSDYKKLYPILGRNRQVPDEIWLSYDTRTNEQNVTYGFSLGTSTPDTDTAIKRWKRDLSTKIVAVPHGDLSKILTGNLRWFS